MYKSTYMRQPGSSVMEETEVDAGAENGTALSAAATHKHPPHKRITFQLVLTIYGACLGSLQFGYNLGCINTPQMFIMAFMNETHHARTGSDMSFQRMASLWAVTVAIFSLGGCVGGLFAGWWATRFGRKGGCLINIAIGVVAAILMLTSKAAKSYEMIIVGRVIMGVHCGLYTGLVPLYLAEMSTLGIRGAVGVLHQLMVVLGLFTAQILGIPVLLGTKSAWNILIGLGIVPCVIQAIVLPFCPESHRYLFISKSDEDASRKALIRLRGTEDIEDEIQEIKEEMTVCEKNLSVIGFCRMSSVRMPLIIGILMQLSQQLSGINGVFFYSTSLFIEAGLSFTKAAAVTCVVGCTMVLMTVVSVPLMDRAGRRTLHLTGLCGMFVISILITLTLVFRSKVDGFVELSIVFVLLYVVFFAIGPGSIPWLIVAELFTHDTRPPALSICVLINWLASFIVGLIFPLLMDAISNYVFLPFTGFLALFITFTFFKVPETKGKTFEEISSVWRTEESPSKPSDINISRSNNSETNGLTTAT